MKVNVQTIKNYLVNIKKDQALLGLVGLNIILTVLVSKGGELKEVKPVIDTNRVNEIKVVSGNINDIQVGINKLLEEIKKPKEMINVKRLESGIGDLSNIVNKGNKENEMKLKALINESNHSLNSQIGLIAEKVDGIKNKGKSKFLPVSKLPFTVLAIDNVQEQGVVDVVYANKNHAMQEGDILATWMLRDVKYDEQVAIFENTDHELLKVSLRVGG